MQVDRVYRMFAISLHSLKLRQVALRKLYMQNNLAIQSSDKHVLP